jgi:hypothetical protein
MKTKPFSRHSTLYFHELPDSLPESVLSQLLQRLERFLCDELKKMTDKYKESRRASSPTPSQETVYVASLDSLNIGEDQCGDVDHFFASSTAVEDRKAGGMDWLQNLFSNIQWRFGR